MFIVTIPQETAKLRRSGMIWLQNLLAVSCAAPTELGTHWSPVARNMALLWSLRWRYST